MFLHHVTSCLFWLRFVAQKWNLHLIYVAWIQIFTSLGECHYSYSCVLGHQIFFKLQFKSDFQRNLLVPGTQVTGYTLFRYPLLYFSVMSSISILFAAAVEAVALANWVTRAVSLMSHLFVSGHYKLWTVKVYPLENSRTIIRFPFYMFQVHRNATPAYNENHLYTETAELKDIWTLICKRSDALFKLHWIIELLPSVSLERLIFMHSLKGQSLSKY